MIVIPATSTPLPMSSTTPTKFTVVALDRTRSLSCG
jgi:hypothetical protein